MEPEDQQLSARQTLFAPEAHSTPATVEEEHPLAQILAEAQNRPEGTQYTFLP